ncbi:hypothetical protein V1282_007202 [Nitrobacteraceae bacterium AZCC 2146]
MAKGLMVSFWLSLLGLVSALICGCVSAQAQQFSADLVTTHISAPETATAGKLRVFNDKVRIETPDFADGFFLVNATSRAAFFARPAERIFMDARQSSRLTRMFVPVDPSDPCRQWQTMAKLAGATDPSDSWLCERIGEEMIDGRRTAIYRAISAPNRNILGWIDADLKFPLRIQTEDGVTITAENIREEPQPARLFEIPPDFRKFDPQALIKRIKQSDVWVDEPPL